MALRHLLQRAPLSSAGMLAPSAVGLVRPLLSHRAGLGAALPAAAPRPSVMTHVASTAMPYSAEAAPALPPPHRWFADFSVYKAKAAVTFKVIPPTWKATAANGGAASVLDREGVLLMEFANANAAASNRPGDRTYAWQEKVTFSLKAVELGNLFTFDFSQPNAALSLFHDPNKGKEGASSIYKTLKVTANPDGYMFSLTVNDKGAGGANKFVGVSVSKGEFYVLQRLADHCIPVLLGIDATLLANHELQ